MPRVEIARLIERPPTMLPSRGSARRSYRSTSYPRRPKYAASNPPARPLPMRTNLAGIKKFLTADDADTTHIQGNRRLATRTHVSGWDNKWSNLQRAKASAPTHNKFSFVWQPVI